MENYEPEFVKMQPKMTVPCMQYGEEVIGDSRDIMYFLSERHSDAGLYPPDQKDAIDAYLNLFYGKFGFIAQFTFGHWINKSEDIKKFIGRGKNEKSIEKLKKPVRKSSLATKNPSVPSRCGSPLLSADGRSSDDVIAF